MKYLIFDIHETIAKQTKDDRYFISSTFYNCLFKEFPQINYTSFENLWVDLDKEYQINTKKGYEAILNNDVNLMNKFLKEVSYINKMETIVRCLNLSKPSNLGNKLNNRFQRDWINGLMISSDFYSIINKLNKKIKIGIVTNFRDSYWIRIWLNNKGVKEIINDNLVISQDIGFRKPHPILFEEIIKSMGIINPADAIYIGDNIIEDKLGAENVGIKSLIIGHDINSLLDLV